MTTAFKGCGLLVIVAFVAVLATGCDGTRAPSQAASSTPAGSGTDRGAAVPTATGRTETQTAKERDGCVTGTRLGSDGNVAETKTSFSPGEPAHITLRFASAPVGSQATIQILDSTGQEVKSLFGPLDNRNTVTFPLRKLPAGRYTAKGSLGPATVCEVSFEIR